MHNSKADSLEIVSIVFGSSVLFRNHRFCLEFELREVFGVSSHPVSAGFSHLAIANDNVIATVNWPIRPLLFYIETVLRLRFSLYNIESTRVCCLFIDKPPAQQVRLSSFRSFVCSSKQLISTNRGRLQLIQILTYLILTFLQSRETSLRKTLLSYSCSTKTKCAASSSTKAKMRSSSPN